MPGPQNRPFRGLLPWPAGIGRPQFAAAGLLLIYLLQCLWFVHLQAQHAPPDSDRALRVYYGIEQWKDGVIAGTPQSLQSDVATGMPSSARTGYRERDGYDQDHSPLYYLIAAAPFLARAPSWIPSLPLWHKLAALPPLFFGVMLGGSLWYVSRRLYGNAGGYIALALYCFSPATIANVAGSTVLADIGAVWGAFGAVFTAIAVAHTLYAPREVVLWNWRRILLLGLSLALAVGNQFSFVVMAPLALLFMLWVAHVRTRAVLVIWSAAAAVALLILFASYFFHPALFWQGLSHARWLDFEPRASLLSVTYAHVLQTIVSGSPALAIALPATLITFLIWRRARYFGNAAPLLVALLLILQSINGPTFVGNTFLLAALAFLFVFVAGILADSLETRHGAFVSAAVLGLLIASAAWNVLELALSS
jgi:hypothetical protein